MQTILGAGSAVSTELAKKLKSFTNDIRLVNRNPIKVNATDILFQADLSDPALLEQAVTDSEVVYVTLGFEYKTSVWKEKWPQFMRNLINSCRRHNSKIVFLDNMYMYDPQYLSDMTEETPSNPISEKGKVRAEVVSTLMNSDIDYIVARSADFYGPGVTGSYLTQSVYNNLLKDKNPQWLGKLDVVHSFTFSKDAGQALAILGNTADAYNQVWHLPTYEGKLTSREWIKLIMKEMNKSKKISAVPVWAMGIIGMFIPIVKELKDISYQMDRDYYFNSSKFINHFNFTPTDPEEGIKEMVNKKE